MKLHPFVSSLLWLSQCQNELYEQEKGRNKLIDNQYGTFELIWDKGKRVVTWNDGEVILQISSLKLTKEGAFDFKIPDSWIIEYN